MPTDGQQRERLKGRTAASADRGGGNGWLHSETGAEAARIRHLVATLSEGPTTPEALHRLRRAREVLAGGPDLDVPLTPPDEMLAPRLRQTLAGLLNGESEKQVAARLGLSRHTVHLYVGAVYRHFGVHSRGELLALVLRADGRHGSASGASDDVGDGQGDVG